MTPATPATPVTAAPVVVPRRHPGRWVAAVIVAALAAMLVHSLAFSTVDRSGQQQPRFQWAIIGHYLFTKTILLGLTVTLEATALAMVLGIVLGVVLAVMRLSANPLVSGAAWLYIWFFRGTPVFVQILFWFDISYVFPKISLGVPFGPSLFTLNLVSLLSPIVAGVLALGLNEGAYMAEIVRAGIISVDAGQTEAASSLGMTRMATMRRIVLPQAMRLIIPVTGNETISMLKTSSLLSVIAVGEMTYKVQAIYSVNYQTVPLLLVASIWYLFVTTILTVGQYYLEERFSRGSAIARRQSVFQLYGRSLLRLVGSRKPETEVLALAAAEHEPGRPT